MKISELGRRDSSKFGPQPLLVMRFLVASRVNKGELLNDIRNTLLLDPKTLMIHYGYVKFLNEIAEGL